MKLKVISLERKQIADFNYEYTAIDSDGKRLCRRREGKAANGGLFIAALIVKNKNHMYPYRMLNLFTAFDRIATRGRYRDDPKFRPYAIAILEEHKAGYEVWVDANWGMLPIKYPKLTLEDRLS